MSSTALRRCWTGLLALAIGGGLLTSCDVQLQATEVTVRLDSAGIHVLKIDNGPRRLGAHDIPAGETVLTIVNGDRSSGHTIMLATGADRATALPAKVLHAGQPSDAPKFILDISDALAAAQEKFQGGAFIEEEPTASFHEYLAAGRHYFLLDARRVSQGYSLAIIPLPRS